MSETRSLRILRLTTRLHISGPALQAILISARLRERGHEVLLVSGEPPTGDDSLMSFARQYGIEPRFIPNMTRTANPVRQVMAFRQLVRLIRDFNPDIIHTHMTTAGFLGRLAARWMGTPVVVHTLHTHPFRGSYSRLESAAFIWLERIGAFFSDSIITLSTSLREELTTHYRITRKNRITILPLGYDLAPFDGPRHQGTFRARWGIPEGAPLIGIIGRLIPVKHHALFLRAAQQVLVYLPTATFAIIGDGPLHTALQAQAQALGLANRMIFTGWQADMPPIYSDLDVVVISSLNEGMPVPLIEGLVAGCRVVATDVGGVRDLLDGGAYGAIVPPDDENALAAAIVHAVHTEMDAALARKAMIDRYSIDRLATELEELYRGLLARKAARRPAKGG